MGANDGSTDDGMAARMEAVVIMGAGAGGAGRILGSALGKGAIVLGGPDLGMAVPGNAVVVP